MSTHAHLCRAIARADRLLPGTPARGDARDPRWQAIIRVGGFIDTYPDEVWEFARRWGRHAQQDLRAAVATCLLEHLLERHFEKVFLRVRREALRSVRFASTVGMCWTLGQASEPRNAARLRRLQRQLHR